MGPSGMQILVIVLIVLILFGGKKIPELAKGLGTGLKDFKKAVKDDEELAKKSEDIKDESAKEEIKKS